MTAGERGSEMTMRIATIRSFVMKGRAAAGGAPVNKTPERGKRFERDRSS
jgi:hypothetical protein